MKVLVTGGAGYIGSHTVVELVAAGYEPVIIDNFENSSPKVLEPLAELTGKEIPCIEADVCERASVEKVLREYEIDAVIHFAGLKAVGESTQKPIEYYRNNLDSTLSLLEAMREVGVKKLVFSSSATVYGLQETLPFVEPMPTSATNPYGWTKVMIEQILRDVVATKDGWNITALRYFNPVGAHPTGKMGEDPNGIPNNLMPYISQVAVGRREKLSVFGSDYPTEDGTGVRDYIHVVDLANAHVAALDHIDHPDEYKVYNIGTGEGVSVLGVVHAFERATGVTIPYELAPRRPGDVAANWADASLASAEIGWKAERTIEDACRDAWAWQSSHPNGYASL